MSVLINHVHKFYNKGSQNQIHVMNDISLELPESGLVAVFGVSGCGKTTLLNAIGGLDKIDSGSIALFGSDISSDTDTLRNKYIGYIFQNYNLNVTDTVYENVASSLRLCGMTDEDEIKRRVLLSLSAVGMEKYKNRTPDTLSGGQMQRVAIARAVVKSPAVILADEPTGNLDENNTVLVMDMLKEISKNHLVILVTHEKDLVDFYCDKVIELVDGHVASVRDNGNASGYVQKNKNDIYLGELEHEKTVVGGIELDLYGNPEGIKLRLVNRNGRLYLKCDTPSVSVIDDTSETRLVEGTFEAKARETAANSDFSVDSLGSFEGSNYGRLFRLLPSLKESFISFYTSRKKKGRRFLRFALIMLAIVFVFMASFTATGISSYFDVKDSVDQNEFYIEASNDKDYSFLTEHIGEHGIIDFRYGYKDSENYFMFDVGAFMTAYAGSLEAGGNVLDADNIRGKLVCGKIDTKDNGIVITTAFADEMLSSSGFSFVSEYEDLLGLHTDDFTDRTSLTVRGIVEGDDKSVYVEHSQFCRYIIGSCIANANVLPAGEKPLYYEYTPYEGKPEKGEIAYSGYDDSIRQGDKLMILGKEYTVVYSEKNQEFYGDFLVMNPSDYEGLAYSVGKTDDRLIDFFYSLYSWNKLYLIVRSSSPDETEKYLSANSADLITPDDKFDEELTEYKTALTASIISVIVVIAIISVCAYFIMRAIFMARVREVGIYRAIGVSKKNMLFRFGVESFVLTLGTVFIGYIISALAMGKLSSSPMFESVFYFPFWFAFLLLVIITVVTVFFGMLPSIALLRKTPSEILSKYDI